MAPHDVQSGPGSARARSNPRGVQSDSAAAQCAPASALSNAQGPKSDPRSTQPDPGLQASTDVGFGAVDSPAVFTEQAITRSGGAPLIHGNAVRILRDSTENYPAWLEAIAHAEHEILFENYII
ncbi:MAG TPA: hypothetical protein VFA81_07875, partial [Burkholderiales bacterium]|nr:hypothetical protein [Burkholderiales bacterium]